MIWPLNSTVVVAALYITIVTEESLFVFFTGAHSQYGSTAVQRTHRVSQLHKHRGFSMRHFRNDITLLKLSTPAQFSAQVNSVCLPQAGSRIPAGTRCYITGSRNKHTPNRKMADIAVMCSGEITETRLVSRHISSVFCVDPYLVV